MNVSALLLQLGASASENEKADETRDICIKL
jgi:hypothetical protein